MNLSSILPKMGLAASLTQDVTLLIVVVLISFLFGVFIGRSRLMAVLINSYISAAIVNVIPQTYLADYTYKVIAFLVLLIVLTLWGRKLFEVSFSGVGSGFMWKIFALSFLEVAMLLSIILTLVPKKAALAYISASSYGYLVTDPMRLVWLAAPLVFLFFIQRR